MTAPVDPKNTNLPTPVDPAQVPAIKKPINKWRKFRDFAAIGDELIERGDELNKLYWHIRKLKPNEPFPELYGAKLSDYDKWQIAEFDKLLDLLNPEDNYEDEDEDDCVYLKRKVISKRLALLIGSKHIGQPTTPEAYTTMLLHHVVGLDPFSYLALESACRELEAEKKFLPDISEVVEAIQRHDKLWDRRKQAFRSIERAAADLARLIDKEQPRVEAELAAKKVDEARYRLDRALGRLKGQKRTAVTKQEAAAKAAEEAQNAVEYIALLEAEVTEAVKVFETVNCEAQAASEKWEQIKGN
jgi:hypothetical protein